MRVQFLPGQQKLFIEKVYSESRLSTQELSEIVKIHPRSFLDWKKEKLRMTLSAAETFCQRFGISLPEDKNVLVARWKRAQSEANKKGGVIRFSRHGIFATQEGRSKGGKQAWQKRKSALSVWKKYTNTISKPEESVDLAEFTGIMLGDGGLTHFQCSIYLNSVTDREFALYTQSLIFQLFNLRANIYAHKKDKVLRVSVSSVDLVEYLTQKGLHIGNKVHLQVGVPGWIWKEKEYIKACIRGLVDTDGCFTIHKYKVNGKMYAYPKLSFSNRSVPILDFVCQGLLELGFRPKRFEQKQIWLYNNKEVKKYLDEIGTNNYKPSVKKILEGC